MCPWVTPVLAGVARAMLAVLGNRGIHEMPGLNPGLH